MVDRRRIPRPAVCNPFSRHARAFAAAVLKRIDEDALRVDSPSIDGLDLRETGVGMTASPTLAIQEPSFRTRVIQGAAWSIVAAVLSRGFSLASTIAMARMLGESVYGELSIVQSTLG